MAVSVGDVVFSRLGQPILVQDRNKETGFVKTDSSFSAVQDHARKGIRNGLTPQEREGYISSLNSIEDFDKIKEINNLYSKIKSMESDSSSDKRVLQYLKSDLAHRMAKEKYQPPHIEIDPVILVSY